MAQEAADKVHARKLREAQARQDHILDVVKQLIKRGGAQEVSIRRVAEEAGFSTTVVYSHFKDKATLITRAMDADLLALVAAMRSAAEAGAHAEDRLRRAGLAYVDYGLEHPDEYALVFMEPRPHAPTDAALVEHGNTEQDPYAYACTLMEEFALDRLGLVVPHEADDSAALLQLHAMTQIFWQGLHGLVSLKMVMGADDPWAPHLQPRDAALAMVDVLVSGLKQRFAAAV
jgi:AcrR family transcriptional regulator